MNGYTPFVGLDVQWRWSMDLSEREVNTVISAMINLGIPYSIRDVREGLYQIGYPTKDSYVVSSFLAVARGERGPQNPLPKTTEELEALIDARVANYFGRPIAEACQGNTGNLTTSELLALSVSLIGSRISFDVCFRDDGVDEIMYDPNETEVVERELAAIRERRIATYLNERLR